MRTEGTGEVQREQEKRRERQGEEHGEEEERRKRGFKVPKEKGRKEMRRRAKRRKSQLQKKEIKKKKEGKVVSFYDKKGGKEEKWRGDVFFFSSIFLGKHVTMDKSNQRCLIVSEHNEWWEEDKGDEIRLASRGVLF